MKKIKKMYDMYEFRGAIVEVKGLNHCSYTPIEGKVYAHLQTQGWSVVEQEPTEYYLQFLHKNSPEPVWSNAIVSMSNFFKGDEQYCMKLGHTTFKGSTLDYFEVREATPNELKNLKNVVKEQNLTFGIHKQDYIINMLKYLLSPNTGCYHFYASNFSDEDYAAAIKRALKNEESNSTPMIEEDKGVTGEVCINNLNDQDTKMTGEIEQ